MKKFRFTPLIYTIILILTSCTENFYNFSGVTWGTTYNITYRSDVRLDDSISTAMRAIDNSLSMFNPKSTVARINSGTDMHADSLVADIMRLSAMVNKCSGGAFDPTVGPLVEIWGFGTGEQRDEPVLADIASARARVGFDKCRMENGLIHFACDGMRLDFSAIAKGYGVDQVAGMLERNGCTDYMVEIGGEINARGTNPNGKPWRIQIDAPVPDSDGNAMHTRLMVIELHDAALATSGNYRNYRRTDKGTHIVHTISPLTGYPVKTATLSVSVIAGSCALADALATAAMAMPYPDARSMIDKLPDAEALFVLADSTGCFKVMATDGFPE